VDLGSPAARQAPGDLPDLCFRINTILSFEPANFPQHVVGFAGGWSPGDKPRIFADAFYNSKDIPFLVACITAVWTLVILSDALAKKINGGYY